MFECKECGVELFEDDEDFLCPYCREYLANLKREFAEHNIPWPGDQRRTLYWPGTGPLIQFGGGVLYIEDLNPKVKTKWRMSRWEMLRLGWNFVRAALAR